MMEKPLYFIPLLIDALQDSDVESSLKNAFCEIDRKRLESRYAAGFRNFSHLMNEAYLRHLNIERHLARELIVSLVCESLEAAEEDGPASNWLQSWSEYRAERQALIEGIDVDIEKTPAPTFQVFRGKQLLLETVVPPERRCRHVENVIAGKYTVKLDIGMTVWEGELTARDLLWSEAFREKDLQVAAQTMDLHQQPTKEIVLLDGALSIRVFAGIESGSIEIELRE